MKVTQEVLTKFDFFYVDFDRLYFRDYKGNTVVIDCTDDQFLEIERWIIRKCDEIREKAED